MKKSACMFFLAMIAASVSAQAGNDGPQAQPLPPDSVIAYEQSSSFWPTARAMGVRIYASGRVESFRNSDSRTIAQLTPDALKALRAEAEKIPAGKLIDPKPDAPSCADAPYTTYRVTQADGTEREFAAMSNCHRLGLPQGEGFEIKALLDGFGALGNLIPKAIQP